MTIPHYNVSDRAIHFSSLKQGRALRGFTLMEMLVVIGIIGIIVSFGVPAIEKLSKPNTMAVAQRQLVDVCSYARQLALSTRATVHIAFISQDLATQNMARWAGGDANQIQKLLGVQNRGYAIYASESVGDQPGRPIPRYLSDWGSFPDHVFINTNEFRFNEKAFSFNSIRFPHIDSVNQLTSPNLNSVGVPTISFNSQGQLANGFQEDGYIPLSQGSIMYFMDPIDDSLFAATPPNTLDTTTRETAIVPDIMYYVRPGADGLGTVTYDGTTYGIGSGFVGVIGDSSFTTTGGVSVILFEGIYINWLTGRAKIIRPGVDN
ncbi:prepilin-type N-terminal cleavage/methylation domain-containing protein [Verrucomicrobia bacterium]|nr:prepilin-type N-terminal cleavage/methylation domain-containing protein [Verrucomicrobiota bacterium]